MQQGNEAKTSDPVAKSTLTVIVQPCFFSQKTIKKGGKRQKKVQVLL